MTRRGDDFGARARTDNGWRRTREWLACYHSIACSSLSMTAAEWTTAEIKSPVVSTRIWRFRPPIFFAPS